MNVPKLRFKNKEGADFPSWIISTLGNEIEFIKGGKLGKSDLQKDGLYQCLLYGELYTSYGSIATNIFSRTNSNSEVVSLKNDVVMPTSGETAEDIATATCIPFDGIMYGGDIIVLRSNALFGPFLSYQINSSLKHKISKVAQGKSVVHIGADKLKPISFSFPCREEQQKIASFFSILDKKINIQKEKLNNFLLLKKEIIRKILKQEVRFARSDNSNYPEWQYGRLEDYFLVRMCKRIFKEQTSPTGEIPFYKIGTFGKKADAYISEELYKEYKERYSFPTKGDTLISCSGTVGRCVEYDGLPAYFQDSNIVWLEAKSRDFVFDKKFLNVIISNLAWNDLSSTTIKRIYSNDLLKKRIPIPSYEEQLKIAQFVYALDKQIQISRKKLDILRILKRGFMQKMFI